MGRQTGYVSVAWSKGIDLRFYFGYVFGNGCIDAELLDWPAFYAVVDDFGTLVRVEFEPCATQ